MKHLTRSVKFISFMMLNLFQLSMVTRASAYEFVGSSWSISPGESVPYSVNFTLSSDIEDGPCLAAIRGGFASWSEVTCSYMAWREEGRTQSTGWGVADRENVVSWRENSWDDSAAALAITSNVFDFRGFIDTDIKFNGFHHRWAIVGEGVTGCLLYTSPSPRD